MKSSTKYQNFFFFRCSSFR